MGKDNGKLFDEGIAKARGLILKALEGRMSAFADMMLADAYSLRKGWSSWSGNTQTGYTVGVAVGGRLTAVKSTGESLPSPLRPKLGKGETDTLDPDYSGRRRQRRTGTADIATPYGMALGLMTVAEAAGLSSKGIAFRMATGTEYSEWLEFKKDFEVLAGSFAVAEERLRKALGKGGLV